MELKPLSLKVEWESKQPLNLNSVVDRFPLTKIILAPTWHFIISSTEWFIVCGEKEPKREGKITFPAKAQDWSRFFFLLLFTLSVQEKSSRQTIMSAVIDRRSPAGPAVKAHYLSDNRPCALQTLANEAVCLGYLLSLKWKGRDVL